MMCRSALGVMMTHRQIFLDVSLEQIVAHVAEAFGVEVRVIRSRSRARDVSEARAAAIWLCLQQRSRPSIVSVGQWFDRDHTTVMYHRDAVLERLDADPLYAERVSLIIEKLSHRRSRFRYRYRQPSHLLLMTMRDHIALAEQGTHAEEIGHCGRDALILLGDDSLWIGGRLLSSPLLREALRTPRNGRCLIHLPRRKAVAAD